MGQSLAQKIIAKAVGKEYVTPGEVEIANIDLAMIHDSGGPRRVKPILDRFGSGCLVIQENSCGYRPLCPRI